MNDIQKNDEIDLVQLIETIWDGKWKIIAITSACLVCVLGFQVFGPVPNFVATSEIKPILAADAEKYRQSNAMGFFVVYRDLEAREQARMGAGGSEIQTGYWGNQVIPSAVLEKMFVEQLGDRSLLTSTFKNKGILVREEFDSDISYERALTQLASAVKILPPINEDGKNSGEIRQNWTLQFEFNDQDQWLATLAEIKDTANKNVRNAIKSRFENLQSTAKQRREFDIQDLDTQIDILIDAYDAETASRLAHLSEQAAIAKKLGISQQSNIPQPSRYQSLSKIETQIPLYLRGYDALEKEIELIKSRQDKRLFISGLLRLEQQKLALMKNQTPERAELLFAKAPVMSLSSFQAASFDVAATEFRYNGNLRRMLALAVVVGGIVGVVYVLIARAMLGRRLAEAG